MVEVDRIMEDDFGIGLIQMMENAGRALARLAQALLLDKPGRVLALAGRGGNGGGVLTAARRLAGWGHRCLRGDDIGRGGFLPVCPPAS